MVVDAVNRVKKASQVINKMLNQKNISMPSSYYYKLGRFYLKSGKSKEAMAQFKKALKINPREASYYYEIGCVLYKTEKYKEAIKYFNKSIYLKPNYINAYCKKGIAEGRLGKYEQALKTFQNKVILGDPDCIKCDVLFANIGLTYASLKKYHLAIKFYKKALKINGKDNTKWIQLAFCLREIGRYKEALSCLNRALRLKPNDDVALTGKGTVLCRLKRHREEIMCYRRAIRCNPKNYEALTNLGCELFKKGCVLESVRYIDKALQIKPRNIFALEVKAQSLAKQKKYNLAEVFMRKIININKGYDSAFYNLACLYSLMNKVGNSIKMLKKAIKSDVKNKILARHDQDFLNIKASPEFKKLTR